MENWEPIEWKKIIDNDLLLSILTKVAPTKGNIVYEYNPFYNYRILQNMYEYKNGLYSLADLWNNFKITLKCRIIVFSNKEKTQELTNYNTSLIKYYRVIGDQEINTYLLKKAKSELPQEEYDEYLEEELSERDYKNNAIIINAAFRKGYNIDKFNLENALKESNAFSECSMDNQSSVFIQWILIDGNDLSTETSPILREAGELTDFITDELNFDLEHPVHMLPQYSYDGSVNLILNDGKNNPKLINSRFSATGKNTYEVCDRKGNNDTNIYDLGEQFTIDTSLYKQTESIAQLAFQGVTSGGQLKVGNYHFYFKVADADGNESDFIAESGVVSIFIGSDSYSSVMTGERNADSHKQVLFLLSNLDSSYSYVHVYYSRYSAENNLNRYIEYKKILKKYLINNSQNANIIISGFEPTQSISAEDINLQFNVVDSAYTSAICLNRLFMANVHKPDIPYNELQDLSLRICPYLQTEDYKGDIDENYFFKSSSKGYIDPKFIYEKTGYWTNELYRFGIVYIMPDNTLTPVFNIRGGCDIGLKSLETDLIQDENGTIKQLEKRFYSDIPIYDDGGKRVYITSNEENYKLIIDDKVTTIGSCKYENIKGVVSFNDEGINDTNTIYSVDVRIPYDVKVELSKYVKGYFFVRQPRIPFVLAQGITIGINKESHTPTIPTKNGIVDEIASKDLSKTHVCVGSDDNNGNSSIDGVVYASEGFLSRYKFRFSEKSSSIWKKIGMWVGVAIAVAASVVVTVVSMGSGSFLGGMLATIAIKASLAASATTAAMAIGAGIVVAGAAAGTALIGTLVAAGESLGNAFARLDTHRKLGSRTKAYNRWNTIVPSGYEIKELDNSRQLVLDFDERIILTASDENDVAGIICPEYELDLAYYNTIFIGDEHLIKPTKTQSITLKDEGDGYFHNKNRHFYIPSYIDVEYDESLTTKIVPLTDNLKIAVIEDMKFRARAGEAEEAFRIESVGASFKSSESKLSNADDEETVDNRKINSDIIRGSFGPYLGFYDKSSQLLAGTTVNIYVAGYDKSKMESYVYQRACDNTTFYTISDRFELNKQAQISIFGILDNNDILHTLYRGDCYLCQFTHRINRNFQDPTTLFNDQIVDENTWRDHYDPVNSEEMTLINSADVNAILMGMWVTFKVRSFNNLNIRTLDMSNVDEYAMTNHARTYYPKDPMSVEGTYKIPEANVYNAGFKKTLSERFNFEVSDVPWLKNWYGTRIMYSEINVSDSFLNGFRIFKGNNYRDYTREYGEITKLISLESSLLCVFEHGVALIPVNERAVAAEGSGGLAYINTEKILPENPKILSDVFGSQWADSVIKVPGKFGDNTQYVYGVDTVAKKIWRTDGNTLTCISDNKIQEFLNNNITLSEFELTPKLGIRNVKTFYNAFKRDVLFTFYDNTYNFEEKVWNLCWNEALLKFVTFYSWVPSVMENINNIPFSFNRNTTKWLAKLGTSHSTSSFADGITLNNVVINNTINDDKSYVDSESYEFIYTYKTVDGNDYELQLKVDNNSKENFIGVLSLSNRIIPELDGVPQIKYELERDPWNNYNIFKIKPISVTCDEYSNLINDEGQLILPSNFGQNPKLSKFKGTVLFYGLFFNEKNKIELPILSDEPQIQIDYYDTYDIMSELYYRNSFTKKQIPDRDFDNHHFKLNPDLREYFETCIRENYPIFIDQIGNRLNREDPHNMNNIVRLLNIKATINYQFIQKNDLTLDDDYYNIASGFLSGTSLINAGYYQSTIAVIPKWNLQFLSTDFWKHGLAGIIDIKDPILPTYWYGEQHPFEFEFIVANDPGKHKIFDNLLIISNKAEPESFHYEIVGECYDFAKDKKNMYIRQEATKELYQYFGSDITFNHNYGNLVEKHRDIVTGQEITDKLPYSGKGYDKSTIFDLYYGRQDHINEIYDSYKQKELENDDYSALAGAELILYNNLNEIRIRNNCKAVNMADYGKGLIRGNMLYKEDIWHVQINPINFILCNEPDWSDCNIDEGNSDLVPVEPTIFAIPDDVTTEFKDINKLKESSDTYRNRGITEWKDKKRKEVKIKDKYLKVRIRYSGKDFAVINAINTLYTISYS